MPRRHRAGALMQRRHPAEEAPRPRRHPAEGAAPREALLHQPALLLEEEPAPDREEERQVTMTIKTIKFI